MFRNVVKEQLKVPAKVEYLGELRDFVTKVGKRYGFSEKIINAFKLSIDEAATNIIKHAYRDWEGDITIRAIIKKASFTIVLIDQGKYFDPRQVNDPDLKRYVDIGKKGGLGIFIMRRLLDNIEYRKTEEGNELWLIKSRTEERSKKISLSAIPVSLKMRYWLIASAIYTLFLIVGSALFLMRYYQNQNEYFVEQSKVACSILAAEAETNLTQLDIEIQDELVAGKSEGMDSYVPDFEVVVEAGGSIQSLKNSAHANLMYNAIIVANDNSILAVASDSIFKEQEKFVIPAEARDFHSSIKNYTLVDSTNVLDTILPVKDAEGRILCSAHYLVDYGKIKQQIKRRLISYLNVILITWGSGAVGLFLLIYVVMNPFRRLHEWVKALGQSGVAEEMDIDSTTEVGEIAQAFSDITVKLRKSQVNLAEQERLQKEMQVAQEIQQTLLPNQLPKFEGYDIASYYEAAKEVGGDYFDFVEVDQDTLGVVVADVSGKGVPGSLVMTMIRTALRTEARGIKDAAEVLARVNDFVVNDMKKGMFVTLFYVIIDSKKRKINYASAGHNPMILYRASKNQTYYLNPRGFPIGISLPDPDLFRKSIESDTIALAEDDILVVYTDGITEAMNNSRELFSEERFLEAIRKNGQLKANEFVEQLKADIHTFTEGSSQNDDITLVAFKEQTTAEKVELHRAQRAFIMIQEGSSIKKACTDAGISVYSYNKKYRKHFEAEGIDSVKIEKSKDSIEETHLSIEEKTKIYDVIRHQPELGAKRISEELCTEKYNNSKIDSSLIYDELVRARLNTKELREAFVARGEGRKRIKPPGTPMLTIDGKVIIQKIGLDKMPGIHTPAGAPPLPEKEKQEEKQATESKTASLFLSTRDEERNTAIPVQQSSKPKPDSDKPKDILDIKTNDLLSTPIDDLFDKRQLILSNVEDKSTVEQSEFDDTPDLLNKLENLTSLSDISDDAVMEEIDTNIDNFLSFEFASEEDLSLVNALPIDNLSFEESEELADLGVLDSDDIFPESLEEELNLAAVVEAHTGIDEPQEKIIKEIDLDDVQDVDIISETEAQILKESFLLENPVDIEEDYVLGKFQENDDEKSKMSFDDLFKKISGDHKSENNRQKDQQLQSVLNIYMDENYNQAITHLKDFLDNYPDDSYAHGLLGNAYFRTQDYDSAVQAYKKVLNNDPSNVQAWENLGVVYANKGEIGRAISHWENVLNLVPNRTDIEQTINQARKYLAQI